MNPTTNGRDHLPPHPPSWAEKFGEDDSGIFACFFVGKVEFEFRWIPPGRFLMGSPDGELGRFRSEGPRIERVLSGFWMGTTPVTQAQWLAVEKVNPSRFDRGGSFPVEQVSWHEAADFAANLARKTGSPLRLPEEVEWEYACRAGTEEALYTGNNLTTETGRCPNLDEIAWYIKNSGKSTHEVAQKLPNAWGLCDMLGNVWEWCDDSWDDEAYGRFVRGEPTGIGTKDAERVVRGGSWLNPARGCRAAFRVRFGPGFRRFFLGFRLAAGQESVAAEPPGSGATPPERRSRARRAAGEETA